MTTSRDYSVLHRSRDGVEEYQLIGPDGAPVSDVHRFLHAVGRRGLAARSLRAYAYDLLCAYRWMQAAGRSATSLTTEDLLDFIEYQRRPPPAADATINRRLSVLQRFAVFMTSASMSAATNQAPLLLQRHGRRVSALRVREPVRLVTPLSDEDALTFFNDLRTARDRCITLLMWADGLRSCEILNLALDDVDFRNMNVKLLGKGRKERMMPLAGTVAKALLHYLALERPARSSSKFFVVLKGPRRGQPMTYTGLHRIFRYHRASSNVLNANPHRFRHTFGANMTRCRVPLVVLAKMMGHSSPQTTMRYVQLNDHEVRQQYEDAIRTLNTSGILNDRFPPAHT